MEKVLTPIFYYLQVAQGKLEAIKFPTKEYAVLILLSIF